MKWCGGSCCAFSGWCEEGVGFVTDLAYVCGLRVVRRALCNTWFRIGMGEKKMKETAYMPTLPCGVQPVLPLLVLLEAPPLVGFLQRLACGWTEVGLERIGCCHPLEELLGGRPGRIVVHQQSLDEHVFVGWQVVIFVSWWTDEGWRRSWRGRRRDA